MKKENEKRIKEIKERLGAIEKIQEPLWQESHSLEDEKRKIYCQEALELVKTLKWILEYREKDYRKIKLNCNSEMERQADRALWKLGGDYHSYFHLAENVTLYQSDGEVFIIFENIEAYRKYVKAWKLEVDNSKFLEKLSDYKKDIKILEDIFSIKKENQN